MTDFKFLKLYLKGRKFTPSVKLAANSLKLASKEWRHIARPGLCRDVSLIVLFIFRYVVLAPMVLAKYLCVPLLLKLHCNTFGYVHSFVLRL